MASQHGLHRHQWVRVGGGGGGGRPGGGGGGGGVMLPWLRGASGGGAHAAETPSLPACRRCPATSAPHPPHDSAPAQGWSPAHAYHYFVDVVLGNKYAPWLFMRAYVNSPYMDGPTTVQLTQLDANAHDNLMKGQVPVKTAGDSHSSCARCL